MKLIPKLKLLLENVMMVAKGFSGEDPQGLSARARELAGEFEGNGASSLGGAIRTLADSFGNLFSTVTDDGDETTSTLESLANSLESIANAIDSVVRAYRNAKKLGGRILGILDVSDAPKFADTDLGRAVGYTNRAAGGSVMGGQTYRVGEFGPETFVPSGSGSIRPGGTGGGNTFIFNGVIDGESARRSIERLLQNSAKRTSPINLVGSSL